MKERGGGGRHSGRGDADAGGGVGVDRVHFAVAAGPIQADTELADDRPDGSGSQSWLRAVAGDEEILLQGSLPVTVTTEERLPGQSVITTTEEQLWPIKCYDSSSWLYLTGSGGIYSESGPSWHDGAPGTWTDSSQSAMAFDCHQQWDMGFYGGDGESGPTTFTLSGTVDLD